MKESRMNCMGLLGGPLHTDILSEHPELSDEEYFDALRVIFANHQDLLNILILDFGVVQGAVSAAMQRVKKTRIQADRVTRLTERLCAASSVAAPVAAVEM